MGTRRNDRCVCGSGKKFKYCCSPTAARQPDAPRRKTHYIDTGEVPVRYVITNEKGTSFFSTKENKIIVFQSKADAIAAATLEDFAAAENGEINVAGVGETKWAHLQETLPFVEVDTIDAGVALIRERMDYMRAVLAGEIVPEPEILPDVSQSPDTPESA
jgi:hypothetical protein